MAARRFSGALAAGFLAMALAIAPPTARTAFAASDPLRTAADATYTLDPGAGRVHVAIEMTETDLKPNTALYTYYYVSFGFALQPEATSVRVTGPNTLPIITHTRKGYIEARVTISKALFYKHSTTFTIRYDLVGGKPRSDSPTRVGAAYSTFGVWAWGDVGRSSVEVRTPAGLDTRFNGDTMSVTSSATTGQILRAKPADPSTFFTIITAEDDAAYAETRLSLAGGVEIVVQSWPEDTSWKTETTATLRKAMPALRTLIGLDWPVAHDLGVRERYTPDLEGYAGFFVTKEQRIEVSEDLDPVTIVHEASHAWLNDGLFVERWIYEGLAEEYAWRAMTQVGLDAETLPEEPKRFDPGWQALIDWRFPQVIRDQDTDDEERYGYSASFWVIHSIVEAVGVDQMAAAFAAADANLTAYPGAVAAETVTPEDDWRRLLDLVEPLDMPDSASIDAAISAYVTTTLEAQQLAVRRQARAKYRELLDAGDGWLPPWSIRSQMGTWSFKGATTAMAEAMAVLALRDQVAAAALALGLTPDGSMRAAYEQGANGLSEAKAIADRQLEAMALVTSAKTAVDSTPDLLSQIGLLGTTPRVSYDAARSAFESGNLDEAVSQANQASASVSGAPAIGQQRLLIAGVSTGGMLLLLIFLITRRRRRSRSLAFAAAAVEPAPIEPYATLAADPTPDPDQGGQAPG